MAKPSSVARGKAPGTHFRKYFDSTRQQQKLHTGKTPRLTWLRDDRTARRHSWCEKAMAQWSRTHRQPTTAVRSSQALSADREKPGHRSRFETAHQPQPGRKHTCLNAVDFANGSQIQRTAIYHVDTNSNGQHRFKFNDPDVYANSGDAYRKFADGGCYPGLWSSFNIIQKYARSKYRIGKVYQTQGVGQNQYVMQYYNEAIALDSKYAPVYYNLFNFCHMNQMWPKQGNILTNGWLILMMIKSMLPLCFT